jgi:hypothetical protein
MSFLKKQSKVQVFMKQMKMSIMNIGHQSIMLMQHLPEKYHISILDGGADTCVLGQGWEVLSVHNTRGENVVGFDHEAAVKRNLQIVSAITAVDLPDGISVILTVHKAIYNDTSNHSLLSEFQFRDFGIKIDSICHKKWRNSENGDSRCW